MSYISVFYHLFPLPTMCSGFFNDLPTCVIQVRLRNRYMEGTLEVNLVNWPLSLPHSLDVFSGKRASIP